jgi:cellulose synthase/poly-beta-1,6-N-acetylglucosamine synthase-like glycosyltransferase
LANQAISALPKNVSSVSVLIDIYKHERFIEKSIISVPEQDFPPSEREIIVVDHGLTDRTPEIVRGFEPSLRYIRKENGGRASGIQHWHFRMSWPNHCLPGSRRLTVAREAFAQRST